jgi:DNA-binding Lrp family transcriptional regulator
MVTAIILIESERGQASAVGERLAALDGISEVYSVGGRFDLVAVCRLPSNDALAELVNGSIAQEEGILRTESLIAFKMYSRHDLEAMFSIGA